MIIKQASKKKIGVYMAVSLLVLASAIAIKKVFRSRLMNTQAGIEKNIYSEPVRLTSFTFENMEEAQKYDMATILKTEEMAQEIKKNESRRFTPGRRIKVKGFRIE